MKNKYLLLVVVFLLVIGCVVGQSAWLIRAAQAAAQDQNWQPINSEIPGKDLTTFGNKTGPMTTNVNTIFLPCIMAPCLPYFSDNFSNLGSGWANVTATNYSLGYYSGWYRITTNPGWFAWSVQDFGTSDFRLELDTKIASQYLDGSGGILFNATSNGFYQFEVVDGYYVLWSVDTSTSYWDWTPLVDWTYLPSVIHTGHETNHMKLVRSGSTIKIYANNQLLNTLTSSSYQGTLLGMASGAYDHFFDQRFDNFALYTDPCIGAQSITAPQDRAPDYGAIQLDYLSGYTRP
jgi:hypothetical protein